MKNSDEWHFSPEISPRQLWNANGILQQFVFLLIMGWVYFIIRMLVHNAPGQYGGLERWLQFLQGMFRLSRQMSAFLTAPLIGIFIAFLLFGLDTLTGYLLKKKLQFWMRRGDFMLPVDKKQRGWALAITFLGSGVEELLFRGFIFNAILPVWDSWIWAALILSALFAFLHAGLQGFWSSLWIFIVSVFLCGLAARGRTIYELTLIHITINLMNLFIIPFLFAKIEEGKR